jgi:hypothetical protein
MFIQDASGGLKTYVPTRAGDFPTIQLWDRIRLRGYARDLSGERVVYLEGDDVFQSRGTCDKIAPAKMTTGAIRPTVEGRLVEVSGKVIHVNTRYELEMDDGSGPVLVYIDPNTGMRLPTLRNGQIIRIAGVVSRLRNRSSIMPRYVTDTDFGAPLAPTPSRTPTKLAIATPTGAPRPSLTRTLTAVPSTRTPTPQVRLAPTLAPTPSALKLDGHAIAVAGGSTSIAASFVFFALAAILWRRRK